MIARAVRLRPRRLVPIAATLFLAACVGADSFGTGVEMCLMGCGGGEYLIQVPDSIRIQTRDTVLTVGDSALITVVIFGPMPSWYIGLSVSDTLVARTRPAAPSANSESHWVHAVAPGETTLVAGGTPVRDETGLRVVAAGESRP